MRLSRTTWGPLCSCLATDGSTSFQPTTLLLLSHNLMVKTWTDTKYLLWWLLLHCSWKGGKGSYIVYGVDMFKDLRIPKLIKNATNSLLIIKNAISFISFCLTLMNSQRSWESQSPNLASMLVAFYFGIFSKNFLYLQTIDLYLRHVRNHWSSQPSLSSLKTRYSCYSSALVHATSSPYYS